MRNDRGGIFCRVQHASFDMDMPVAQTGEQVPPPAIYKPKELWTGKQIVSLVLPKINLKDKASNGPPKDKANIVKPNTFNFYDHEVTIQDGELLAGTIDKKTIGMRMGGIIHTSWLDRGFESTQRFMNLIQQETNYWVLQKSFSIGVTDALADKET